MATMMARWRPSVVLQGLVVAALVVATAQAATVTIYNPAGLVVNIQNDDKNVKVGPQNDDKNVKVGIQNDEKNVRGAVTTAVMAVKFSQAQLDLQFSVADGEAVDVTVHDGDVLVVIPDPTADVYSGNAIKAFKVLPEGAPPPRTTVASIPQYDVRPFLTPSVP